MEPRILKFRALNASTKKWEYGNLLKSEPTVGGEYFINIAHPFALDPNVRQTACIAGTEGQFTGLKDKNGVEIYEGDIVKAQLKSIFFNAKIVFNTNVGCFQLSYPNMNSNWVTDMIWSWEVEVIGNIHQSPELLLIGGVLSN